MSHSIGVSPRCSIILPVYNAAATIERAFQSIVKQSVQDWELLLGDDGSSDSTAQFAAAYAANDTRVRYIRYPHRGVAVTLNALVRESRSPILVRMDADDEMHPERLAKQLDALEADPHLDLVSCRVSYQGKRPDGGYAHYVDWTNGLCSHEELFLSRYVESPFAHPSVCLRRQSFERWGGYRESDEPEDYGLWLEAFEQGAKVLKIPETLLTWHDHSARLSRTDPRYDVGAFYRLKCRYLHRHLAELDGRRRIVLWGAGRTTRRRFDPILDHISAFADVDPKRIGNRIDGRDILNYKNLKPYEDFVLCAVGNHGARKETVDWLRGRGFVNGTDFLLVA